MRSTTRLAALALVTSVAATSLLACGSDDAAGGAANQAASSEPLTYWASQQSPSVEQDEAILTPQLEEFTAQTGVEVELEVIPFTDLLTKILTATTSSQGPDVLNIGNTWTPSLQASGALVEWDEQMMDQLGGSGRFESAALETTGAEGSVPVAVPLYTKVYQLYYNKRLFKAAGIEEPPQTWDEFTQTGRALTKDVDGDGTPDQWGLGLRGQAATNAAHFGYMLGSAHGAEFFDEDGAPAFDSPEAVEGIQQYLSWIGQDGIVNPSDAENADWANVYEAFAGDRAAMMLVQTLGRTLEEYDLTEDDYGVAPMPALSGAGEDVGSIVGGTNVAIFRATENLGGATELVKFLTSAEVQVALNSAYGTIPPVTDASDPAFETAEASIARETLATRAIPMPRVPEETQFETLVGQDIVTWVADTATGSQPDDDTVAGALEAAAGKVSAGG